MKFLGIDCGTQGLRVAVWDPDSGRAVSASKSYGLIGGLPPGHKEQNPDTWLEALDACLSELRSEPGLLAAVRGIGVSGQQHGLVVLDSSHDPIRAAKLWCDTSTEAQCRTILSRAGGIESYRAEIGNSLPPGFTASKILWLKENEPRNYRLIQHLLLPHDFLNLHLTGELVAEPGDSSGTGYYRIRQRTWSTRALRWIDPDRDLSKYLASLAASESPIGGLRKSLAERWGLEPGTPVSSGGGDNMMGAIGSGNVHPGVLTVSLGTSGTIYAFSGEPIVDELGEIAAFCDSTGGWLPLGCTMNVTVATEMIRSAFLPGDHESFDRAVQSVRPGADGLVLLPYLEGERMPNVPEGTGVLFGLRPESSSPAHLARSAMEGVTMGLNYGLQRLRALGVKAEEVRLIGGGARSRVWRQIVADVFHLPVRTLLHDEGPAFGAALQACWAVVGGRIEDLTNGNVLLDPDLVEPEKDRAEVYRQIYGVYDSLSRTLRKSSVFESHRALVSGSSS